MNQIFQQEKEMNKKDRQILRELAKQYMEICNYPIQDERRKLWTEKNSLKETRPLIFVRFGMWNAWCKDIFGDHILLC